LKGAEAPPPSRRRRAKLGGEAVGTRRVRISFRMDRFIAIYAGGRCPTAWCEACGSEVRFFTPEAAAAVAGVTKRTMYQWVETGKVHFTETAQGATLICINSLLRRRA
jgi:hypothetical protein